MVYRGLTIACGMLPVIGIGMLLTYMPTKKYIGFVAIGFVLVAYMNLSVLPVAIVGAAVAYEYYKRQAVSTTETVSVEGGSMKMSDRTPVLTKKDLRRCALRSWINVNLFNYETQLGGAVAFAEAKALRKIYPDDDDYQKAMMNQFKYYNTMPYFHGLLLGAGLAMEDKDGLEALMQFSHLK